MKWSRWIVFGLFLAFCACGGQDASGPPATPQAAAKGWFEAAMKGDEAAVRELTVDAAEEALLYHANRFRESFSDKDVVQWSPTTAKKWENKAWLARIKGSVITFEMTKVDETHWLVADILTSD